jgi:hypothetical protein
MHWLDPDYLPLTKGHVKQFLINPDGDADGFMLTDGTEIHFPPHLSAEIQDAVAPGDAVTVRGAKPRGADLVAAVAVDTASGHRIDDKGPSDHEEDRDNNHRKSKRKPIEHEGIVVRSLHGPKGEARGVLFKDGVTARFPKHQAEEVLSLIVPGVTLAIRGDGLEIEAGTVIEVNEIGSSLANLKPLKNKKPKRGKDEHDAEGSESVAAEGI